MMPRRTISKHSKVPLIIQSAAAECGLACMAMVTGFYGHEIGLFELRRKSPVSAKGMTLKALFRLGQKMGMVVRGVRIDRRDADGLAVFRRIPGKSHLRPVVVVWVLNPSAQSRRELVEQVARASREACDRHR